MQAVRRRTKVLKIRGISDVPRSRIRGLFINACNYFSCAWNNLNINNVIRHWKNGHLLARGEIHPQPCQSSLQPFLLRRLRLRIFFRHCLNYSNTLILGHAPNVSGPNLDSPSDIPARRLEDLVSDLAFYDDRKAFSKTGDLDSEVTKYRDHNKVAPTLWPR